MAQILLVDDNEPLLELTGRVLQRAGHQVSLSTNGRDALNLVQDKTFDLVITDLVMPEKEGIETILELRRKFPALRIIAMSGGGLADPETNLKLARHLGAVHTLAKPFSSEEFLAAVASVLS